MSGTQNIPTWSTNDHSSNVLVNLFGRQVINKYFNQMVLNEDGTIRGEDCEALHDMRVATRRLRVAFEVFGTYFDPGIPKSVRKKLRKTCKKLGVVRDYDILVENLNKVKHQSTGEDKEFLTDFIIFYCHAREPKREKLISYLNGVQYKVLKEKMIKFLKECDDAIHQFDKEKMPAAISHRLIGTAMNPIVVHQPGNNENTLDELHSLRIEIKKFRYTLEFLEGVHEYDVSLCILNLKYIQDHLGEIQDTRFIISKLENYFDTIQGSPHLNQDLKIHNYSRLRRFINEKEKALSLLIRAFPDIWKEFLMNPGCEKVLLPFSHENS